MHSEIINPSTQLMPLYNFTCQASSVSELVPELIMMGCDITTAESDVPAVEVEQGCHPALALGQCPWPDTSSCSAVSF